MCVKQMVNYENVKFDREARSKLIEGVNLIANAVEKTYGPKGKNVCIKRQGSVKITKDGATVASAVNDPDPFISMGIEIMKDISVKTAETIGDGSTTSLVIARALVNQFEQEPNPIELSRELSKDCDNVLKYLATYKKDITSPEDLMKVATLSANNDPVIGKIVADAFTKVGKDGIVQFVESEDVSDRVEYTEGFRIDSGFSSPYFVNNFKKQCVLENVMVYISDTKMEETKKIQELAGRAMVANKSLLLIAPDFDSEIILNLARNLYDKQGNDKLKSCTVKSPEHRNFRDIAVQDLRILLGESMTCEKVIIDQDHTTFIGTEGNQKEIQERIESIRSILDEGKVSEMEMNFHKKRLANFTSGIATIYVGGYSEVEIKERKDRVEDAVMATQAALDEGILPGAGSIRKVPDEIAGKLCDVLQIPFKLLCAGAKTEDFTYSVPMPRNYFWDGYDFKNNKYGDLYEMGIIEPYAVIKHSLLNAVNTASLILTCDCLILK